jgi:hypothetical protein
MRLGDLFGPSKRSVLLATSACVALSAGIAASLPGHAAELVAFQRTVLIGGGWGKALFANFPMPRTMSR